MAKIFIVRCRDDGFQHNGSQEHFQHKIESESDFNLENNDKEQALSIYELLSNECELQNPINVVSSSSPNDNHKSNSRRNNTLRDGSPKSSRNQETAKSIPRNRVNPEEDSPEISLELERNHHEGTCRRRKEIF